MVAKEYRLAALDMDGTLLNSAHEITPYTREVVRRVYEHGKIAAISTGRCLSELWEHFEELPDIKYAICENGACVYDIGEKKIIDPICFPHETVLKVFELASHFDVKRQFFRNNQSCMEGKDLEELKKYNVYGFAGVFASTAEFVDDLESFYRKELGSIEKFNLYCTDQDEKLRLKAVLEENLKGVMLTDSICIGMEVSPEGATKARGLKKLCEYLNVPVEESIAVGDASNDLDILKAAGLSVAMGNATDAVKSVANVVTEDCDHDGAAKALQRYMLDENV